MSEEKALQNNPIYNPSNKYNVILSSGQQYIITGDVFLILNTAMQTSLSPKLININAAYTSNPNVFAPIWINPIHVASVQSYNH